MRHQLSREWNFQRMCLDSHWIHDSNLDSNLRFKSTPGIKIMIQFISGFEFMIQIYDSNLWFKSILGFEFTIQIHTGIRIYDSNSTRIDFSWNVTNANRDRNRITRTRWKLLQGYPEHVPTWGSGLHRWLSTVFSPLVTFLWMTEPVAAAEVGVAGEFRLSMSRWARDIFTLSLGVPSSPVSIANILIFSLKVSFSGTGTTLLESSFWCCCSASRLWRGSLWERSKD